MTFLSRDIKIRQISCCAELKNRFSLISRKLSTLGHMLLHKLNINVAIANVLLYRNSLYDHHKPKYKIIPTRTWNGIWAWPPWVHTSDPKVLHKLFDVSMVYTTRWNSQKLYTPSCTLNPCLPLEYLYSLSLGNPRTYNIQKMIPFNVCQPPYCRIRNFTFSRRWEINRVTFHVRS